MSVFPSIFDTPAVLWATEQEKPEGPGLYVSPNTNRLPVTIPQATTDLFQSYDPPSPWPWFYTQVSRQDTYWTSLCSLDSDYEGMLQPLSDIKVIPRYTSNRVLLGWTIRAERRWKELEGLLDKLLTAMKKVFPLKDMTPLLIEVDKLCKWPSDYGYEDTYPTEAEAKDQAKTVRAVFDVCVAKLTYAAYLLPEHWLEHLLRTEYLSVDEAETIRASCICQASSATSGAHLQRAGLIVDVRSGALGSYLDEVKALVTRFMLPVWLYYGRHPRASDHVWSAPYLPSEEEIARSRALAQCVPLLPWPQPTEPDSGSSPTGIFSSPFPGDALSVSVVPSGSTRHEQSREQLSLSALAPAAPRGRVNPTTRQRAGQTIEEFFREAEEEKITRMSNMSDTEREKIERRAAEHANLDLPRRDHKCNVYRWEEVDGNYTRILVGHKHWKELWNDTTPSQRRYNPLRNEFDVCQDFDPTAVPDEDVEFVEWDEKRGRFITFYGSPRLGDNIYGFSDSTDDVPPLGESIAVTASEDHAAGPSVEVPEKRQDRLNSDRTTVEQRERSRSPRQRASIRERYGRAYQAPSEALLSRGAGASSRDPRAAEQLAGRATYASTVSAENTGPTADPEHTSYDVSTLVGYLSCLTDRLGLVTRPGDFTAPVGNEGQDKALGRLLGHLHESLPPRITEHARVLVDCLSVNPESFVRPPPGLTDLSPDRVNEHPRRRRGDLVVYTTKGRKGEDGALYEWYMIYPQDREYDNVPFMLCLQDPVSVNHILRKCPSPSLYDITSALLEWGVPFQTLRRHYEPSTLPRAPPPPMFYDTVPLGMGTRPRNFVFSLDDYHKYEDRRDAVIHSYHGRAALTGGGIVWRLAKESHADEEEVMRGPSGFHTRENLLTAGDRHYVDDTLLRHQLDVICGVYRVMPENDNEGRSRAAWKSWWPSASTWSASGMAQDYWSPDNERWFVGRMKKILEEGAQPLSASQWRKLLAPRTGPKSNVRYNARVMAMDTLPPPA